MFRVFPLKYIYFKIIRMCGVLLDAEENEREASTKLMTENAFDRVCRCRLRHVEPKDENH